MCIFVLTLDIISLLNFSHFSRSEVVSRCGWSFGGFVVVVWGEKLKLTRNVEIKHAEVRQ